MDKDQNQQDTMVAQAPEASDPQMQVAEVQTVKPMEFGQGPKISLAEGNSLTHQI